jgi:hypothetical protein
MSDTGQQHLLEEIRRAINHTIDEYEISYPEVLGCLMMAIQWTSDAALKAEKDNEE